MTTNPLLDFSDLPQFASIQPSHVAGAVETLISQAQTALDTATAPDFPADWKRLSATLDVQTEKLSRAWGAVGHLNAVADTPELRAAYNEALPKVSEFYTALGSDERLFAKYKAIDAANLNKEQKKAHSNALRSFKLGGAELQGAAKERFAAIQTRLSELSQKFSENTLDSTEAFAYFASLPELEGLPEDVISTARSLAQTDGKEGYKLTLKMPCYLPVMQYAKSSELRKKLYMAHNTRASELFPASELYEAGKFDNTPIMRELLALRQESAKLLGYENFAEVSLVPKMANSPDEVVGFLHDLAKRAKPFAEKDVAEMREFATEELGMSDPQAWDWSFIGEKLKEVKYSFSEQEVKQYFTAPKVLEGLFNIIQTLFEVDIQRDEAPVWNPKVEFYALMRGDKKIAQFYIDKYSRSGKQDGAWLDRFQIRWKKPCSNDAQLPICVLVLDWPENENLTHDHIVTLFHEFGHALHHMLTEIDEYAISGISGVEWDAVEVPSQLFENYCWQSEVISRLSIKTSDRESIPKNLISRMLSAKNFQSSLQLLRQIELAIFDMELHQMEQPDSAKISALYKQTAQTVNVLTKPSDVKPSNSFMHIFSGDYSAGYYSYLWAEVISADIFYKISDGRNNHLAEQVSSIKKYVLVMLSQGGLTSSYETSNAVLGRPFETKAFLSSIGLIHA
jgi:oligopeptidase A